MNIENRLAEESKLNSAHARHASAMMGTLITSPSIALLTALEAGKYKVIYPRISNDC